MFVSHRGPIRPHSLMECLYECLALGFDPDELLQGLRQEQTRRAAAGVPCAPPRPAGGR